MALSLGAMAAVQTVEIGSLYSGAAPTDATGKDRTGPFFTITFEDGADASVAGGVDITLKAVGLDQSAGEYALKWVMNFEPSTPVSAASLALKVKALGDFGIGSYQLQDNGVGGVGGGFGQFDIGITFDDTPAGRFVQGDGLQLTFVADGATLSNSDFFGYGKPTGIGSASTMAAVELAGYANGGGGAFTYSALPPTTPAVGPIDAVITRDITEVTPQITEPAPEASTVIAGLSVSALGLGRWIRARRRTA